MDTWFFVLDFLIFEFGDVGESDFPRHMCMKKRRSLVFAKGYAEEMLLTGHMAMKKRRSLVFAK